MTETSKQAKKNVRKDRPGVGYKSFKAYVRFIFSGLYNRKTYVVDRANIPEEGPLMIVSNHQNSLNDALALVMAVGERGGKKVRAITRADAFKPPVAKLFRWIGLMPAFRLQYDGAETLSNNTHSFSEASEEILNDGTVIIYPEAGHQDKHWLGTFTYGYLKILFDAAEASHFEKEIYLLPSCNHYEDYLGVQTDMMIRFGKPIALSPFYELYQTKPRTAQRQINALVREQISDMMLDITDLDNYESIDFLRNTYGIDYARRKGLDPDKLPEKLAADKLLFKELNDKKEAGEKAVENVYCDAFWLNRQIRKWKIDDSFFDKKPSVGKILLKAVLLLALFPLFILGAIPNLFVVFTPELINKKIKDFMFHGTIRVIFNVLVGVPVTCLVLLISVWTISGSFLLALISIAILPILFIFAHYYTKALVKCMKEIRFRILSAKGELSELVTVRQHMYETIHKLLQQ
ncbi:1-acyl-sn-glycerol-3-phosphate acyltransferase [Parabacteroides sp. OttesenSCG-928-J18]|nr:1-acyl-sn-glycerol-3-phosphate acyltransferase [Parabacteroides sp. OttesenSCG-928-J18]